MMDQVMVDTLFEDFISGTITEAKMSEIVELVEVEDVSILLHKVDSLTDPSEYFRRRRSGTVVEGFFRFIDFVSALVISLGESGRKAMEEYKSENNRYTNWINKYVTDERFTQS